MTRVLLVDDKPDNLAYLGGLLQSNGFDVELTHHGADALARAHEHPPDVVISDLLMPVMDGYTLLGHWKADAVLKHIPFIVYTATYTAPEDQQLAVQLGADAFILKPGESEALVNRVREVLGHPIAAPRADALAAHAEDTVLLRQYNEALIRKLEEKTVQLEESNRELLREIFERGEIAQTQIAILNALPAHIALVDAEGVIVAVNEAWRRYASQNVLSSPEYGIGQNYLRICDAATGTQYEEAAGVADGIRRVLKGESAAYAIEYPCHSPTEQRWFRMMVTPLHSYRTTGAVVMHVDVSDRKGAEHRLRESQEQYLLLLNSTAEGIYGMDFDGFCTFCNPAAARFLGFEDPDEIVGQQVHDQHHYRRPAGGIVTAGECRVHGAFRGGDATHGDDEIFYRKDGSHFPVEYWSHPIRRGGEVIGAVVAFLDISERRSLEAQFLQSQKMEAIGRLAGGVAHDFNNALQVVLTCSELLEELLVGRPTERGYVREIRAAGERGASLTRHLLAFSRKQFVRPVLLDLNAVVGDIQAMLRRMIGEDVRLITTLDPSLCAIEADAGQIEQVLMNLAVNARDAMPRGGELIITTSVTELKEEAGRRYPPPHAGRYALLCVRDTGCGMDADTLSRIFELFFTTKEAGKGTGLGLSTVYGIVKQSGGFIEVDSEPDHGTTFWIYLPAAVGVAAQPTSPPTPERRRGGTESILLVEDERSLLTLVSMTLRAHGYTVLEAGDGLTGIAMAGRPGVRIDLLVTDVILPDLSGPQVVEQLLISRPELKVLYISGYTDDYISHPGVLDGETLLLEKPFSIGSLLAKIREALDAVEAPSP
jgi:PAS domain S-box-containing protein